VLGSTWLKLHWIRDKLALRVPILILDDGFDTIGPFSVINRIIDVMGKRFWILHPKANIEGRIAYQSRVRGRVEALELYGFGLFLVEHVLT